MTGDDVRLQDRLAGHFRPEPTPQDLLRRILAASTHPAGNEAEVLPAELTIRASARGVTLVRPGKPERTQEAAARRLVEQARGELLEYFAGRRAWFSVPVDLDAAPPFQRQVLQTALRIPFGEARPYAWVARRIGHPRAVRAVGTALARNPVPLLVPCHRVLRSDGGLGGYAFGLSMKRRLLQLERTTPLWEGCSTTRVVCRVGCAAAARMRPDHRVIFASVQDARSVGYRPCRLCRPDDTPPV
jgi:O-6-methylguanine DNA methyltransferase